MEQVITFLTSNISLIVAVAGLVAAFFQWRRSVAERNAFRQQLISAMHHAEGIASELTNIGNNSPTSMFTNVTDVTKAVQAVQQNASALFFGLMETKIGGRSIKDDIDSRYSQWVDLEFQRKLWALQWWIADQKAKNPKVESALNDSKKRENLIKTIYSSIIAFFKYILSSEDSTK